MSVFYDHPVFIIFSRNGGESFVTALISDEDIGAELIEDGVLMVDRKGGRKLAKLVKDYEDAMAGG